MARSVYNDKFTLKDIFTNRTLSSTIPYIGIKDGTTPKGKLSIRTSRKNITATVFQYARNTARPFYKPMVTKQDGDDLYIDGDTESDLDIIVDDVYNKMLEKKPLLTILANDIDEIRYALKYSEKMSNEIGITPKLYLRALSIREIKNMSEPQLRAFMNNVMENIYFSPQFTQVQQKFGYQDMTFNGLTWEQASILWQRRVGIL